MAQAGRRGALETLVYKKLSRALKLNDQPLTRLNLRVMGDVQRVILQSFSLATPPWRGNAAPASYSPLLRTLPSGAPQGKSINRYSDYVPVFVVKFCILTMLDGGIDFSR